MRKRRWVVLLIGLVLGILVGFGLAWWVQTPQPRPYRPILTEFPFFDTLQKAGKRTWRVGPSPSDAFFAHTYDLGWWQGRSLTSSRRYFAQTEMPFGAFPFSQERQQFMETLLDRVREAIQQQGATLGSQNAGTGSGTGRYASQVWQTWHYARGDTSGVVHIVLLGGNDDTVTLFFAVDEMQVTTMARP